MEQPRFGSVQEYALHFTDVDYWRPYVEAVCARHDLGPGSQIQAGLPGTFPVFLIDERYVVKFFGDLFDGPWCYAVESDCYALLASRPEFLAPRLLGHGSLFPEAAAWQWPYLISTLVPGTSLGTVREQVSGDDIEALVRTLGPLVRQLHTLPMRDTCALVPTWERFAAGLRERHAACAANQRDWQALPEHLIDQIDAYLPPIEMLVDRRTAPLLLHSDLNEDHVLGVFAGGHWKLTGIIDFGDAMAGDWLYELIALHIGLWHCDKRLLRVFLETYGVGLERHEHFALRALSYTLLHEFAVLRQVFEEFPAAATLDSLEELAARLWDPDRPGLT